MLAGLCALGLLLSPPVQAGESTSSGTAVSVGETTRARWLMGTLFTFRASGAAVAGAGTAAATATALEAALDSVAALESRLSNGRESSELSRLNATGVSEFASAPLVAVLDSALALAALTGGAFDPTVEPLTRAWDLRGEGRVPTARAKAEALAHVDWRRVHTSDGRVRLDGAQLDLGGIGKGFALDRAAAVLRDHGLADATLDAGGQLLELGAAPCSAWVAHPSRRDEPAVRVVFRGGSLSTSSQSERWVRAAGRRLGHILDTRSGTPLETRASVSVWAASGTRADALSTALLVMGRDAAGAFAAEHRDIGLLWLEPFGRRARAYAWNLDIAGAAPFVTLQHSPPLSLPSSLTTLSRIP